MQSEHPGGWEDVVAFMEQEKIFVPDARGRTLDPSDIIKKYSTGMAASMLCRSLLAHGWYVPGDVLWLMPCVDWHYAREQERKE